MTDYGVSEWWMPFATGAVFPLPFFVFVWLLNRIPDPGPAEVLARVKREPMDGSDRAAFFLRFLRGMVLLLVAYGLHHHGRRRGRLHRLDRRTALKRPHLRRRDSSRLPPASWLIDGRGRYGAAGDRRCLLLSAGSRRRRMMDEHAGARCYHGPLRALIFDWAGTTVDYGCRAPTAAFIEVFAHRGVEISSEEARGPMGRAKRDHICAITELPRVASAWRSVHGRPCTDQDIDELYADFLPRQLRCIEEYSDVIPGVVETIETCRKRGLKIGSSTGYTREIIEAVMARAREQGFAPDAMLCASDIAEGRPAPWLIFENARRLGVYPMAAVAKIDDTVAGIEAGLNAGTWTIGVAKTGNEVGLSEEELFARPAAEREELIERARRRLREAGCHYVVDSVSEMLPVLEEIDQRLAAGQAPL